mgnify:CR=1 FL=1
MTLFFGLLFRILVLAFSFAVSTLAAALFVMFVLFLGGDASWLQEDPAVAGGAVLFTFAFWLQAASLGFAIVALVFLVMEIGRFTSLVASLVAGGLCASIILFSGMAATAGIEDLPYDPNQVRLTFIAAGFVGGLVHWLIAGHRAGRWIGPRKTESLIDPR